jgi:RimJ/RimL family protein N-acetyltransferase
MKNGTLIFEGKRIYLRELREEDASEEYCNWLNDPIVNKFLETRKATIKELKEYIREKKENINCLFLGIFLKDTNKHIGNVKLEPIDWTNKKATIGILIGDRNYWGQGLCVDAGKILIKNVFKKLKINKIEVGIISVNKGAIVCALQAGLKIDNFIPKAVKHENIFYDKIIMSINKE